MKKQDIEKTTALLANMPNYELIVYRMEKLNGNFYSFNIIMEDTGTPKKRSTHNLRSIDDIMRLYKQHG
jgi:hypothetical protein